MTKAGTVSRRRKESPGQNLRSKWRRGSSNRSKKREWEKGQVQPRATEAREKEVSGGLCRGHARRDTAMEKPSETSVRPTSRGWWQPDQNAVGRGGGQGFVEGEMAKLGY